MRTINVTYHQEPEGWWAESVDAPSFYAAGATRDQVCAHTSVYLPGIVGGPIELREAEFTCSRPLSGKPSQRIEWSTLEGVALSLLGAG